MVKRHPHTFLLELYEVSTKDTQGNPIKGILKESLTVEGRAKENDSMSTTVTDNGDVAPYHISISMPLFNTDFSNGFVTWNNKVYAIIKFRIYQNRCKIWA